MDTITTAKLFRQGESSGGVTIKERNSADFIVNGESLYSATEAEYSDLCGRFSAETAKWNPQSAQSLLLSGDPDEGVEAGRFMIFVCSECDTLECGAITCAISQEEDYFVWQSFAYENGYDPDRTDFESYSHIGPFRFPLDEYREAIHQAALGIW